MMANHKIFGFTLSAAGLLFLCSYFELIKAPHQLITSIIFMMYGIISVFNSFGSYKRGTLALGSIIFLTGTAMFVVEQFEILQTANILFPSILFIVGGTSFILFLDNISNFIFFLTAVVLIGFSTFLIAGATVHPYIRSANYISNIVIELWPVLLFFAGVGILLRKTV
ncbi:MAG: hypothetical protein PHW27_05015 [Melioribacteraceae bacterium]|nr:hypothetical protein [Melioribacteraceae bacterium]